MFNFQYYYPIAGKEQARMQLLINQLENNHQMKELYFIDFKGAFDLFIPSLRYDLGEIQKVRHNFKFKFVNIMDAIT